MTVAASVLFLPSCGQNNVMLNNSNNLITPKNTYTITLSGVDANGEGPSNAASTSAQASIMLTVN